MDEKKTNIIILCSAIPVLWEEGCIKMRVMRVVTDNIYIYIYIYIHGKWYAVIWEGDNVWLYFGGNSDMASYVGGKKRNQKKWSKVISYLSILLLYI